MWRTENKIAFLHCLGNLEQDVIVQNLKCFHQHTKGVTRYDHCLLVAYFSFIVCRRLGLDYSAAARGGMLHDLYHEHWEGSENGALSRWRTHPLEALQNAQRYNLSPIESDIIVKHMWPVTPEAPAYKESFVVTCADKLAAILEKTHLNTLLGISRNLQAFYAY